MPNAARYDWPIAIMEGLKAGLGEYQEERKRRKQEATTKLILGIDLTPGERKLVGESKVEAYRIMQEEEAARKAREEAWTKESREYERRRRAEIEKGWAKPPEVKPPTIGGIKAGIMMKYLRGEELTPEEDTVMRGFGMSPLDMFLQMLMGGGAPQAPGGIPRRRPLGEIYK